MTSSKQQLVRTPSRRPPQSGGRSLSRLNARDARRWIDCARRGDFEAAWRLSDRILARHGGRPCWHLPRHLQHVWDGSPLDGRRVLVRCYHGLGDTLQFVRYAPLLQGVAREVIVWAQPDLLSVLETCRGISWLLPLHDGTPEVDYDVDVEIMELPYVFRTTLSTIPAAVPYLFATPVALTGRGPRVGLVWRSGAWDPRRSIPFGLVTPLFDVPGIQWYQLQCDAASDEGHPSLRRVENVTVLDTARYTTAMDLVITIDSLPAHLAGALGVPVWTLLQHEADWRWLEGRSDSPWYPTMRLFRQPAPGEWRPVLRQVRESLQEWAAVQA